MIDKEIGHKKVELDARNEERISTLYMRAEKQCFFECAVFSNSLACNKRGFEYAAMDGGK